jgi:hypothetical protein
VAPVPVQLSATSQLPVLPRHTVPDEAKPSAGQAALVPVQLSATSQVPALPRHTVPDDANPSAGQLPVASQTSAASQAPDAARHTVFAGAGLCRHILKLASQVSMLQGLWSSQSAFELHCAVMTQSDGSEFGCIDGYEQTSVSTAVPPNSLGLMQHEARASNVVQLGPAHLLALWEARPAKGSVGRLPVHAAVHAIETLLVQRSGRESPHW